MLREILKTQTTAVESVATSLPQAPGVNGGDVVGLGASMLVIVGIIVVLGWMYSRSRFIGGGNSDVINVVATRALGPKERLMVVEVADQQLLVGMTANGMQTLHVLEKPLDAERQDARPPGFAGRLRNALQEIGR